MNKHILALALSACTLSSAQAGFIVTAVAADVSLAGEHADRIYYANGINTQSNGRSGGSTSFGSAFANAGSGAWIRLAAFGSDADNGVAITSDAFAAPLTFTFDQTSGRSGAWTVANRDKANDVKLDLVFAMHTGGGSGVWLFDEAVATAGSTLSGSWNLNLKNNGGNYSGYSNLTIFARDYRSTPVVVLPDVTKNVRPANSGAVNAIPEPAPLGTMLLGLGVLAAVSRRQVRTKKMGD